MKVLFTGTGSIACRHIKNLVRIKPYVEIDAVHHSDNYNCPFEIDGYIKTHYIDYNNVPDDYDIIFITNPTSEHFNTLMCFHDKGRHFFIEKPVFSSVNEDTRKLNFRNDSIYYVACPLRYTKILQYIKNNIDFKGIYSVRCISSSYLPDWRPEKDYRKSYSGKKRMGGGVSLDLIHEWDYIIWLLGFPGFVSQIKGKKSDLDISSDDIAVYVADYPDKVVEVHLDYFGRMPIRKVELFGREDTITADLIKMELLWLKDDRKMDFSEDRDEYQTAELNHFFSMIEGAAINDNNITHACRVLEIAECEKNV